MYVTTEITIDFQRPRQNTMQVVQDDTTRKIRLILKNGGNDYDITSDLGSEETWVGAVAYLKPDGHGGVYDTTKDGEKAVQLVSGTTNQFDVLLVGQVFTAAGWTQVNVKFYNADFSKVLSTFAIDVNVQRNAASDYESEDYSNMESLGAIRAELLALKADTEQDVTDEYAAAAQETPGLTYEQFFMSLPNGRYRIVERDYIRKAEVVTVDEGQYCKVDVYDHDGYCETTIYTNGTAVFNYVDGHTTGRIITKPVQVPTPVNPTDTVNKAYVDNAVPPVDSSLSVENAAADAKAVGDSIGDIKQLTVVQNLFDKSKTIQGGYFNGSGGISNNQNSYYNPEYIPVTAGIPYTFTAGLTSSPYYIATYNSSRVFQARKNPTGTAITFDSGIAFVRISIYNQVFNENFKFAASTEYADTKDGHLYLDGQKVINAPFQSVITEDETVTTITKNTLTFGGNYYPGSDGTKTELSTQFWYEIVAVNTFEIWCNSELTYPDIMMAVYNNGSATKSNFVARYRKTSSSDTLPTAENKLTVTTGQLLAISVSNDSAFVFVSDGMKTGKSYFVSGLYLSDDMIGQVNKKAKVIPLQNAYQIVNGDVAINFSHTVHAGSRSDLWNFNGITKNGNVVVAAGTDIVGVIRETDESDFMGGVHGDETCVDFNIFADGKPITEETECDKVDIFMYSHLTRVSTGDNIVDRFVHIAIENNTIEIETTFTALTGFNVYRAYCGGMFAWYEDQKIYAASNLGELVGSGFSGVTVQNSHDLYTATVITNDYMAKCENLVGMNDPDSYGDAYYYGNEAHPRMKLYLGALKEFEIASGDKITGKSRYTIR